MSDHLHRIILFWKENHQYTGIRLLLVGVIIAAGVGCLLLDTRSASAKLSEGLVRNESGKGSRTEELVVSVEGKKKKEAVSVEISEQQYTKEEIHQRFAQAAEHMERRILGGNKSLDRVETDLNLITKIPEEPIEVEWELDRYDVVNVNGEIQEENLSGQGDLVSLRAVLTYNGSSREQGLYECSAMVYPQTLTGGDKLRAGIQAAAAKADEQTRTKDRLILPDTVQDHKLTYYRKMDTRGLVLLAMAVLVGILLYALERQNQMRQEQGRRKQMLLDYPEVVNKFTLLLGAGMTVKGVWKKVITDYEEQKEDLGVRYAYEEMKVTWNEMQGGITEAESYERFGRRCGLPVYLKFGALLSQNLRKGTKGLTGLLKADAAQAFEERKAQARRLGEEAGTKLLVPMFLMLSVVLIIVVVPAFLSMQL